VTIKILVLEDDPKRIETFRSTLGQHDLVVATEAANAIKALQESVFDIIFLDHDLGGQTFVSTADKNTGSEVVRWMCENMEVPCQVIIHSLNAPAALDMKCKLEKIGLMAQRIPFTHLRGQLHDPTFITES